VLIRRGFKFELKPNGMQIQLMKQFCGCARYVYNRTLSLERSLYKKDNKHSFKYAEAANRLPEWKKKNPFLKECHSQVLQQSLKDLNQAYTNFFRKRANFPKYKEKFQNDSIRFPQGVELDEVKQQIRLPKIGWMGYRKSRDIEKAGISSEPLRMSLSAGAGRNGMSAYRLSMKSSHLLPILLK